MGAKPAHDQRSSEPNHESRCSFQQKYLHFPFFSTPPSSVSKSDATQRSPASKPETFLSPSLQQKDVLLFEWWLIKTKNVYNGRRLAVGGFSKRGQTVEIFTSGPISKRHDDGTLETADGITLRLQGPINKTRTFDNGFPFEVSTTFLFGFPTTWDSSAAESSEDNPSSQPVMGLMPESTFEPSSQKRTVFLRNWWLRKIEKVDGSRLAVGGFDEFGKAMRIYNSSPITKRHDVYTLETSDGTTIMIQGYINKTRTLENGFPLEACKTFLIGFPTTWTNFANNSFGGEPSCRGTPVNATLSSERSSTILRDGIPEFAARGYAETVDKGFEIQEDDRTPVRNSCMGEVHSEAAGCQLSEVDGIPQEKLMDDGKLDFIQDATSKNSKKCSGHALSKGHCDEMIEILSDFGIGQKLDKEETVKKKNEKFYESSTRSPEGVRSCLSKLENLHDEDQKFAKTSAKPAQRSKRLISQKVGNVQGDFLSYSQYLNKTCNVDSHKFVPSGSETSATSQATETLVEGSPSSSNIYQKDKCSKSSSKPVKNERIGLKTLGNVHVESQDHSQFLNDINNVSCSNIAPDGSKTSTITQPNVILVEGSPLLPNLCEENMKFAESSAKPATNCERLALARLGNFHEETNNHSQLLGDTCGTNYATLASKTSATCLPNYTIFTESLSSPAGSIPVPSDRCPLKEDQDSHQNSSKVSTGATLKFNYITKYGSTLTPCLLQSLNEQRTSNDEGTPTNSNAFSSTFGKNMIRPGMKKKEDQTARSRTMVDKNDSTHQRYFTTEENISICRASNSRRTVHHTRRNQNMVRNSSIRTPESLSLKRSRSGRLLLPTLDCSTRIIYEADGSIAGTANIDGSIVETSEVGMSSSQCKGSRMAPDRRKRKNQR